MEKLKCKVVMLPTNEKAKYGDIVTDLYFISDREIKEDDYYLINDTNAEHYGKVIQGIEDYKFGIGISRIEATTDPSLNLPLIGEPFIQKYVEKQGDIKEVMIEMILQHDLRGGKPEFENVVNTRRDNTVIISPVKDSWTKEEVVNLCLRAIRDTQDGVIRYYRNQGDMINPIKWIADNLQ